MKNLFNSFYNFLRVCTKRIADVFTIPPVPDFNSEIKNTWGDWNIKGIEDEFAEHPIPFDDVILEISLTYCSSDKVYREDGRRDRYHNFGIVNGSLRAFSFYTNFNKKLLNVYIESVKRAGLPKGSVGICKEAKDRNGKISPNSYAIYLNRSIISEELYAEFGRLVEEAYVFMPYKTLCEVATYNIQENVSSFKK